MRVTTCRIFTGLCVLPPVPGKGLFVALQGPLALHGVRAEVLRALAGPVPADMVVPAGAEVEEDGLADMGVMVDVGEGGITRLGLRGGGPVRGEGHGCGADVGGGHVAVVAVALALTAVEGREIGLPELATGGALEREFAPAAALRALLDAELMLAVVSLSSKLAEELYDEVEEA